MIQDPHTYLAQLLRTVMNLRQKKKLQVEVGKPEFQSQMQVAVGRPEWQYNLEVGRPMWGGYRLAVGEPKFEKPGPKLARAATRKKRRRKKG